MISRKKPSQKQMHPTNPKTQKETAPPKPIISAAAMKKKEETQHQNGTTTAKKKDDAEEREISDGKSQKKTTFVTKRKLDAIDELEQQIEPKQKLVLHKRQIANSVQKQPKTEEKNKNKAPATRHQPANGVNPLDTILDEIEAFDTANKKNKKVETEDDEPDDAPCSSRQLPPTPMPGSYRSLNRMELARQDQDHCTVQSFLARDDLMQRILAYKMLKGRVESYSTIRVKIDLDNCIVPEYELSPTEFDKNGSPCDKMLLVVSDVPAQMHPELLNNPETPDHAALKRGPMTPPGSPGTNLSSTPEADAKPATFKKLFEDPSEEGVIKEMVRNFCSVTGISTEMIRTFLGDEFYKLDKLKMEDLMKTFLVSLKQITTKKDKEVDKECSSTKVMRSPVSSVVVLPKDENKSIGSGGFRVQAEHRAEDNFEVDAMEISSQSTASSSTLSFSNGVLPPPPAPPPFLDGTETVFVVPPPPPPPLHKSAPSLQPSQDQFASPSISQMPSNISPSNVELSSLPNSNRACKDTNALELADPDPFPAVIGPYKKLLKRQRTCDVRGNKRLKPLPPRFPRPLKTMPRRVNTGGRLVRTCQKITTATMNTLRPPVPLLSLNLIEPSTDGAPIKSDNVTDNGNALVGTSVQMQQTCGNKQQPQPSREVPVMVDLEFIKNTPPPPIPDIIKRRISSDNKLAGMAMLPTTVVPFASQVPKFPPQSLLHMDLTRPPVFPFHRPPPAIRQPKIAVQHLTPAAISQSAPNVSTVFQTIVQAIGGAPRPPSIQAQKTPNFQRHLAPSSDSPYGKFF